MASPTVGTPFVQVAATLDIRGTRVTIASGDLANLGSTGLVFNLPAPVVLGTIDDLIDYLNTELGLPFTSQQITADIDDIDSKLPNALAWIGNELKIFMGAPVTLTLLNINTKTGVYQFGATMDLATSPPNYLLDLIAIDSIGLVMGSQGKPVGSPS